MENSYLYSKFENTNTNKMQTDIPNLLYIS